MTDEELVKRLREWDHCWPARWLESAVAEAADRIDELEVSLQAVLDREAETTARYDAKLETLTEQLEAARADAKEAEGYAEGLERDLKTCCMEQGVMDNTVAELEKQCEGLMQAGMNNGQALILAEAKLAKAVEAVSLTVRADNLREAYHALPNDHNRIGDKRSRKGHAREAWLRAFRKAAKTSRAVLAEIEGLGVKQTG
jgi:hypothetical protein